jgi:hypothetical protein
MARKHIIAFSVGFLCCLALVSAALADSASTYTVDRFIITSGGGGGVQSESYGLEHFVIAQTVSGSGHSQGYDSCSGPFCNIKHDVYLPIVLRNSS